MRLWSPHPRFLDRRALVACWRETLLAQKVLDGGTSGYTRHPQLVRFRALDDPLSGVGAYLSGLATEADARGYSFNRQKIAQPGEQHGIIPLTTGQLTYEVQHLRAKVEARDPAFLPVIDGAAQIDAHPIFTLVEGPIEEWERV